MYQTIHPSSLYFRIYKVFHKSDTYIKCKVLYFYKSNNEICTWLNPESKPKTYKLDLKTYNNYTIYAPDNVEK